MQVAILVVQCPTFGVGFAAMGLQGDRAERDNLMTFGVEREKVVSE